jgi:hypothetical protein
MPATVFAGVRAVSAQFEEQFQRTLCLTLQGLMQQTCPSS